VKGDGMIRGDFMLNEDVRRGGQWTPHGQPDWAVRALATVPLFQGVSRRHLRRVVKLVVVREYGDGVRVVRLGSQGEAFHIVLDGKALVELPGEEEIVLRPGDAFGELALIDGAPRSATVVASGDLTTGRIGRADFRRLLREEPAVAVGLLPGLVGIVRYLEDEAAPRAAAAKRASLGDVVGGATTAVDGRALLGWTLALRHVPLFVPLSDNHLRKVATLFDVKKYRDGSVLVREGDPGDSFCVLLDGRARVEREGVKTHELQSGDWFGELALIDGAPRAATITAQAETTVARLSRSAFQKLLKDEPRIALGLTSSLVALIRELQRQ
jgi:CRP-like cAMP-binding protein